VAGRDAQDERNREPMDVDRAETAAGQSTFYRHRQASQPPGAWSERYGERHRLIRITDFPLGIQPPRRVRIYRRRDHFLLQWWDKAAKRNLSQRVDGDLVTAIVRAREIDERLEHFQASGLGVPKTGHDALVEAYTAALRQRADAGEIDPRTAVRYANALQHYRAFAAQADIQRRFPQISLANRDFALALMAYLNAVQVLPNGHPNSQRRPMQHQDYVLDVVRGMYAWAADPERGNLIPEGFRNPFLHRGHKQSSLKIGEPDISAAMAAEFLGACDAYQLRLFGPMALYGLRAAEPCFLFHEHLDNDWLKVPCLPELAYDTKGHREKRLPVIPCIAGLLNGDPQHSTTGLLYVRRDAHTGRQTSLAGGSLAAVVREYQQRCAARTVRTAVDRRRVRDQVLHDAGAMTYDHIVTEFRKVARSLSWPASATIKDFRHLFATCLENCGMPEHYRKFLMGQSPGRAAIVTYTHLNEIRQRFGEAVDKTLRSIVDAIQRQGRDREVLS